MNPRVTLSGVGYVSGQPLFCGVPFVVSANSRQISPYSVHRHQYMFGHPGNFQTMTSAVGPRSRAAISTSIMDYSISQLPLNSLHLHSRAIVKTWLYAGSFFPSEQHVIERDIRLLSNTSLQGYYQKSERSIPIEFKAPNPMNLDIIHHDPDIVVVNKESRLLTTPNDCQANALMNGLIARFPYLKYLPSGGLVHRLDFDTSGACMVALNRAAYNFITLNRDKMKRTYWCIVDGHLNNASGTINIPVPSRGDHSKMQDAVTHYKTLEHFANHTLVECKLETGRLNQIRIHMDAIGHPIVGDKKYNKNYPVNPCDKIDSDNPFILNYYLRHFRHTALHAIELSFEQPRTGEQKTVQAHLPYDFNELLRLLRLGTDPHCRLLEEGVASMTRYFETDLLFTGA